MLVRLIAFCRFLARPAWMPMGAGVTVRSFRKIVAVLLLAIIGLASAPPARAASPSAAAVEKTFHTYMDAGNYAAALTAAQTLAPMIRASRGERSVNYAIAMSYVAGSLSSLDRYGESVPFFLQAISINDALQLPNRNLAVALRADLGGVYDSQGYLQEAETLFRQAIPMIDPTVKLVTTWEVFNNFANVLLHQGRYHDAEEMNRRALAMYDKSPANRFTAASMQNLAIVLMHGGRFAEAEVLFKRALSIREQVLGPNHKEVAQSLLNLGALLTDVEGRNEEAIAIYQRAISIQQVVLGTDNDDMAMTLGNLAGAYSNMGRNADAESVQLQALAIREKVLGPKHPDVGLSLNNLGVLYANENRWGDAEKAQQRSLAIWDQVSGPDNPLVAVPLSSLGLVYLHEGKFDEAEAAFKRALALRQNAFGPDHPGVAQTLDNLSALAAARDRTENALDYSRKAADLLGSNAVIAASAGQTQIGGSTLVGQNSSVFRRHVTNLAAAARKGIAPDAAAGREAFEAAQWATQSAAAAAVAQMGVRFAAGNDALAALVRESQDLSAAWGDKDKALTAARALPADRQNRAAIDQLERDIRNVETQLARVEARLQQQFPDYAALANPKPLKADDVQKLLRADEALVYFLLNDEASYVFALTRDAFAWHPLPFGADAVSAKIAAFRRGLDVDMIEPQNVLEGLGKKRELFDLDLANDTFASLLGPVDVLIKDRRLLVVPSGPLTALPFHLLVTEKPSATPDFEHLSLYRDAAWLFKRQAVSVLPSVASLSALRLFGRDERGSKPMVGFGNPVFNAVAAAAAERGGKARSAARRSSTRSYTDFWQGAAIDRRQLAQSLPQLPDTADELNAVALSVGAPSADIHLGRDASVTTVKRLPLADFRIVYFATHGLVAGDVKGLAEPSLVLTIPAQPSALDDGLLTASEVAKLRLNADWVVLSACNTIAGEKPGAEALSGLARAFFYAGARALLVSHWSVDSDAATRITTATFDILKADQTLGRAEALRRSMLAYINDTSKPENAYPALWGPFSIIGEGAAR